MRELGGIDILVNNAGVMAIAPIDDFRLEDLDRTLAVNVRAVFVATQAAAFHLQTQAVKFLLENGAEVNLQDREGQTALHQAVKPCLDHESLNTAQLLLERGADLTILDRWGNPPWSGAYPSPPSSATRMIGCAEPGRSVQPVMRWLSKY